MKNSNLVISDRRFLRSPFFNCYHHEDVLYGIYNNRLYPLSCGYDDQDHYKHLRKYCCLYDVPETPLRITGKDKEKFLEKIFTRNIDKIKTGRAVYAFACNHDGGILMDGVLMHPNEDEFIYVQANGDFLNWAQAQLGDLDASIYDFDSWVLQIQGPTSLDVLEAVSDVTIDNFPYYGVTETDINGTSFYISRSGWTGERGFEIYSKNADFDGVALWDYLLEKGKNADLMASDVSSMHIRRLEAGILDYGTDIDQTLNPYEIGLERLVHLDKSDFIGREALMETNKKTNRLMGIVCAESSLIRGDKLLDSDKEIGFVSAGAWSPTLDTGIGLIRLNESKPENYPLKVVTASGDFDAKVVELPFFDKEKLLTK